jgi:hypothetical protein
LGLCKRRRRHDDKGSNSQIKVIDLETNSEDGAPEVDDDSFLTPFDYEVIDSLFASYNTPLALLRISFPALLSLALCPITLYMYQPFTEFLWPKGLYMESHVDIFQSETWFSSFDVQFPI